jgi:cytochrome c553
MVFSAAQKMRPIQRRASGSQLTMNHESAGAAAAARSSLMVLSAALAAILMAGSAYAAGDIEAGRTKSETCKGCHAAKSYMNIYPTYNVPKIVGQSETYIAAALRAYRSGERTHPTMRSQAGSMSDQDIDDVAAYIGSLGQATKGQ